MAFNATFNNISVIHVSIMMVSFVSWGNRNTGRKPPTCRKSL